MYQQIFLKTYISECDYMELQIEYKKKNFLDYKEIILEKYWWGQHDINETKEEYLQRVRVSVIKYYAKYQKVQQSQ